MGRPRLAEGTPAVTRLEEAFFEALRTTPFQAITISGVVRAAGLNRNSFYYHYSDLADLAQSAVGNLLNSEIPRLIANGFGPDSEKFGQALSVSVSAGDFDKVLIATGPHSTAELRAVVKNAVLDLWLGAFDIERGQLDLQASATLHFILGGALELLAQMGASGDGSMAGGHEALSSLRSLPVIRESARIMAETLRMAGGQG